MKRKYILLAVFTAWVLGGCATRAQKVNMRNDWRAGIAQSPYRSISPVIVCDDCKLQ
jgi:hypothetical protein